MTRNVLLVSILAGLLAGLAVAAVPASALPVAIPCFDQELQPVRGTTIALGFCGAIDPMGPPAPSPKCNLSSPGSLPALAVECHASFASDGRSYVSGYFSMS